MGILSKVLGDPNKRFLEGFNSVIEDMNDYEKELKNISDEELKSKTHLFKNYIKKGKTLDDILPEVFAVVKETARRTLNQRAFDTQLLGGIVLHQGKIAEMKTGEGKTLSSTLPAYLNALEEKGVHVVTVNDYLSRRDAVWMGQIFHFLGLTVGCLNHEASFLYDPKHSELDEERDKLGSFKVVHEFLGPCSRKEAYEADITYGTNNEFGFDYLRDSMVYPATGGASPKEHLVQREHNYAIVDEIDSILIDEARTPLIISMPDEESAELYKVFAGVVPSLKVKEHYTIDEKQKSVSLTESGIEKVENLLGIENIYTEKGIKYVHHLNQALRAYAIFRKDKDYVVKDGKVMIVDEFTGRLMPGRNWSEGLHQAVEAKENVGIQKESRTLASITFQNYFRMYKKLSGMTGTALTSAEELHKVYNLEVSPIPTNKPLVRKDKSDLVYSSENGKFKAVAEEIKKRHQKGQPVLVGTVSIEKNEYLSALLQKEGVPHKLLNAKHHEEEGEIIAQAGRKGAVTVATNMAGRGVDIVLGGMPEDPEQSRRVKELGGLFVLGTERHEARRIDNQLRGRSGRQGDPGESRFFVSLEDDLMRIFGSDKLKNIMGRLGVSEDQPIENSMVSRAIESAQSKIEGMNFDARKHLLEYDDVMNKQRTKIYAMRREVLFDKIKEFAEILIDSGEKKMLLLRVIDMLWMDHLEVMDYTRSSVGLRAYGNRDPLIEYKNEGIRLFKDLEKNIRAMFVKLALSPQPVPQPMQPQTVQNRVLDNSKKKVGRNDPCPCGSGKKYKRCCLDK